MYRGGRVNFRVSRIKLQLFFRGASYPEIDSSRVIVNHENEGIFPVDKWRSSGPFSSETDGKLTLSLSVSLSLSFSLHKSPRSLVQDRVFSLRGILKNFEKYYERILPQRERERVEHRTHVGSSIPVGTGFELSKTLARASDIQVEHTLTELPLSFRLFFSLFLSLIF